MKQLSTSHRATLICTASALGLILASQAQAASLNTNLVRNGSFESITNQVGDYDSRGLTDWSPGFPVAAAYNYNTGYASGLPSQVPGFAALDQGDYFYWGGGTGASFTITQVIDVSTGATSAAIGSGTALYSLSGFFSSYQTQGDFATITAEFLGAGASALGMSAAVGGADALANTDPFGNPLWGYEMATGAIPVGTQTVRVSIVSTRLGGGYNDAYVDLVDFRVSAVPVPAAVWLAGSAFASLAAFRRRG